MREMAGETDARFAIYFAPPAGSGLHRFGSTCLGRDAESGEDLPHPRIDGVTADRWRTLTASPGRYGFHATLKPPFHLAPGRTRAELVHALCRFAAGHRPLETAPLRVTRIASFVALVLRDASTPLSALADGCLRDLDQFRAPPSADDLARRRAEALSPRQRALLEAWGYPYVMDEWRFHMTLASGLERAEADAVCPALERLAAPVCRAPLAVDAICLFEQPARAVPFRLTGRFPFGGPPAR
jgi:putative phosphonate metabolism protein